MNNVLKGNDIKNHTFYCFDDIIKVNDPDLDNILLDEKSYENIWIYDVARKTRYDTKHFLVIFEKLDGYIRKHDETNYVVLYSILMKNIR